MDTRQREREREKEETDREEQRAEERTRVLRRCAVTDDPYFQMYCIPPVLLSALVCSASSEIPSGNGVPSQWITRGVVRRVKKKKREREGRTRRKKKRRRR